MVARAMNNFGLNDLVVVSPRENWLNNKTINAAKKANSIIKNIKVFSSLEDAISNFTYVIATTNRKRYLEKKSTSDFKYIKKKINSKINLILKQKKKIYILGASTKGNTILQFLDIDNKKIPYAIERNKHKIGAQTIGSNIKIIGEKSAKNMEPDYKLVLPWHFKKEIIKREYLFLKAGGKLIFPLPNFIIINKKNFKYYV